MSDAIKAVVMPKWGLAMTEGKVNAWLVPEGAEVKAGDEILEIETSKITNVHESPFSGQLRRRVANEGDTLPVGALLGVITEGPVADAALDAFIAAALAAQEANAAAAVAPPEPRTIEAGGLNIRYLVLGEGDATPLVLIHGFGGDLNNWQFNQPALAEDRRVYALDLPGHGGSAKTVAQSDLTGLAATVRATLAALGIVRAHLAGHSLGGAIALRIALDDPARVASVTLVNSAGLGPDIDMEYINGFIAADRRKEMKAAVEKLFADPALVSRDMVEDLVRFKRLDGVGPALRAIADAVFPDGRQGAILTDQFAGLDAPVQVIWGEHDRIIPVAHADVIPPDRRHVLPATGHMTHIEKSGEVNRLITAFIATSGG